MSVQTIYAALNGLEIKQICKQKLNQAIDNLPLLKIGNTFHRAEVQFGFTMTAYPTDVPVPQKELEFHLVDETLEPSWNAYVLKLKDLVTAENRLLANQKQIEDILDIIRDAKSKLILEDEALLTIDAGDTPDRIRVETGLDIPVAQRDSSGKMNEGGVAVSSLFKKKENQVGAN